MLIWIFNFLDAIVVLALLGGHFGFLEGLLIPCFVYLVVKGIIFINDPFSILDLIIAVYLIILIFGISTFLTYIFALYMLYKIILSLKA